MTTNKAKTLVEECPHCGAVTSEYIFHFSYLDAMLLLAMAREIRHRCTGRQDLPFGAINKVHIPSMQIPSNVSKRMTITSKLGLIAKFLVDGHQESGMWLITSRGWAALRGEGIPERVAVYRKKITERFTEKITLAEALKTYPTSSYNPKEWWQFGNEQVQKDAE